MIELTVKTLDSKNHSFSVPDDTTVKQLKERITESINIPADSQRLIYCGRVLQDDKNLSEYDVNGKVIHLVQRAPPGANTSSSSSSRTSSNTTGPRRNQQWRNFFGHGANSGNAMYLGAMAFPAEIVDLSAMRQPRQCLSQSRLDVVRTMLQRASTILNQLENPSLETSETPSENGSEAGAANNDEPNPMASTPLLAAGLVPGAFIIDGQQIDAVEIGVNEVPSNNTSEQSSASPEDEPQASGGATNGQQPPENDEDADENSVLSRYPRTTALADLLDQAAEINTRVQPFMSQYQQLMRDDPFFSDQAAVTTNQRLFSNVSEIMHNLAHAYHALSDIMCDFSQQPPRILRCRPVLIQHSAVVQTGIPIQVSAGPNENAGQQNSSSGSATSGDNQAQNASSGTTPTTTAGPGAEGEPSREGQPAAAAAQPTELSWADMARLQQDRLAGASRARAAAPNSSARTQPTGPSPFRFTRVDSAGPPGLEVFVDVGPGSITIDSVETTVVTNASGNSSEQNTWQNPPEFVQNLLSAVAGQLMGGAGLPHGVVTVPVSVSVASTTGSTSQSQPAATSATQNSQARGNTATHPTTATQTRSTPRPHVHLSPSINGLRTNNFDPFLPCNSHHITSNRPNRRRARQTQGQGETPAEPRVMTLNPSSSISISVRAGRDSMNNYIPNSTRPAPEGSTQARLAAELQRFIQDRRGADARTATVDPSYPPQIAHLIQAMHNVEGPATLAQVLENVPGYSYTPGENILTDIFMTLAQSLSFLDMVQLGLGSSECLVRARPQLRQLISERLLNNQPLTLPATTQIIDTFNSELNPHYSIFENARLRQEVDLTASINLYNHSILPGILHTIMDEDQATFHRTLLQKSVLYVRQLCALIQYCCLDGVNGLESILRAFVVLMTTGVPDALQEWTMSHSIINFRSFVSTINNHSEDIKRYLVYRKPASSSQPSTAVPPGAEPMDTQDSRELTAETTATLSADIPSTQHTNDVLGWQSTLPSDWVPIITRDSQRQRRQNPQGPFSDAYMSGMPSKRRKLITSAKPQGNLSQVISESMATALGAAGMSSGPEVDVIAQRAGQDTPLRTAYREQIRSTLHYNLNTNPDYLPEKYPNTTKYLKD